MKPTSLQEDHRQSAAPRRRSLRGAITRIALVGGIAAVIVSGAVEAIAALVTGTWPSGAAHLLAALLALIFGCSVAVIAALSVLAHGVEGTVNRLSASVHTLSTSVAGAADAAITIEQRRASTADTGGSMPGSQHSRAPHASDALSGLLAGVEQDGDRSREPEQAVLAGSPL